MERSKALHFLFLDFGGLTEDSSYFHELWRNLRPGKPLLIPLASCIDNALPFCFALSLRKTTYLCLGFATFPFHFHKSRKLSSEWKGKSQALKKSYDLFGDNVPVLNKEKMFSFHFFFPHLGTIHISVNSTLNTMFPKLLKSLVSCCSIYVLLQFQRCCEIL